MDLHDPFQFFNRILFDFSKCNPPVPQRVEHQKKSFADFTPIETKIQKVRYTQKLRHI